MRNIMSVFLHSPLEVPQIWGWFNHFWCNANELNSHHFPLVKFFHCILALNCSAQCEQAMIRKSAVWLRQTMVQEKLLSYWPVTCLFKGQVPHLAGSIFCKSSAIRNWGCFWRGIKIQIIWNRFVECMKRATQSVWEALVTFLSNAIAFSYSIIQNEVSYLHKVENRIRLISCWMRGKANIKCDFLSRIWFFMTHLP